MAENRTKIPDWKIRKQLFDSIKNGKKEEVEQILNKYSALNSIHYWINNYNEPCADTMMKNEEEAAPSCDYSDYYSLMGIAAKFGHPNIIELLYNIQKYRFLESPSDNESLIIISIKNKHFETARSLIELGADVNKQDKDGNTPLMIALQEGDIDIVEDLLKNGADVYADNWGMTVLDFAIQSGDPKKVKLLLDYGLRIYNANIGKFTGSNKGKKIIISLLAEGKNIPFLRKSNNLPNFNGGTRHKKRNMKKSSRTRKAPKSKSKK